MVEKAWEYQACSARKAVSGEDVIIAMSPNFAFHLADCMIPRDLNAARTWASLATSRYTVRDVSRNSLAHSYTF